MVVIAALLTDDAKAFVVRVMPLVILDVAVADAAKLELSVIPFDKLLINVADDTANVDTGINVTKLPEELALPKAPEDNELPIVRLGVKLARANCEDVSGIAVTIFDVTLATLNTLLDSVEPTVNELTNADAAARLELTGIAVDRLDAKLALDTLVALSLIVFVNVASEAA